MRLTSRQQRFLMAASRTETVRFEWRVVGRRAGLSQARADDTARALEQYGLLWREEDHQASLTTRGKAYIRATQAHIRLMPHRGLNVAIGSLILMALLSGLAASFAILS